MKKVTTGAIAMVGVALALFAGAPARGGASGAAYLGPKMCMACHKASNAAAVEGWQASAHARAFWKIDEADDTHKVVADFAKSAPFSKDQVAWVVGAGNRRQAFLDKDFKLLPGEWVVKSSSWQPRDAVDAKKDCLGCHTSGYDPAKGAWVAEGVTCEMCHGPGSAHAGSSDKLGTIVRVQQLAPDQRAMVCGRCHSQGKSKDGQCTFAAGFTPGDDLDQSLDFTKDVPKGAMNAQYNEMRFGGGKHLAAGTVCTTCHDPHGTGGAAMALRQPAPQLCLSDQCHGGGKLKVPPHSEATIKAVSCVMCHMPNDSHAFLTPHT